MENKSADFAARGVALMRALAERSSRLVGTILLTVVYWTIIGPISIVQRGIGADPLSRRRAVKSGWVPLAPRIAKDWLRGPG